MHTGCAAAQRLPAGQKTPEGQEELAGSMQVVSERERTPSASVAHGWRRRENGPDFIDDLGLDGRTPEESPVHASVLVWFLPPRMFSARGCVRGGEK